MSARETAGEQLNLGGHGFFPLDASTPFSRLSLLSMRRDPVLDRLLVARVALRGRLARVTARRTDLPRHYGSARTVASSVYVLFELFAHGGTPRPFVPANVHHRARSAD
jgi:hypothetical protein